MTTNKILRTVWLVRHGRDGEDESRSLETQTALIGFQNVADLTQCDTRQDIAARVRDAEPDGSTPFISNITAQLYAFALRMQTDDVVVLPLKTRPGQIAVGRVTGSYRYQNVNGQLRHTRAVQWIREDVPRTAVGQDLLYSLGAFMTVCRIQRNRAEHRFAVILGGERDPEGGPALADDVADTDAETATDETAKISIVETAHQQILDHIQANFPDHELARLTAAVLQAEGYATRVSPPGPDGGVDILAGRGVLGFDDAGLCVQVKAAASPVSVNVLRELQGTMQTFGATQGLLVSWGGFTGPVEREARQSYFSLRLWTANDLLDAIYRHYDQLPEDIRTAIPLNQIWTLVRGDDQ